MAETTLLGRLGVAEQGACHADQGLARVEAEATERADAEYPSEAGLAGRRREGLGGQGCDGRDGNLAGPELTPAVPALDHQDLPRPQPSELLAETAAVAAAHTLEGAGRQLEPGECRGALGVAPEGGQVAALGALQQAGVGHRSGGVGADDLAPHQPLGGRRILDLLGHRHPESGVEQLAQVAVEGVVRDAAHRRRDLVVVPAPGEGDPEHRGRLLGVLEEQLVEVAHPVQQQRRAGPRLEVEVLPQHGGHFHDGHYQASGHQRAKTADTAIDDSSVSGIYLVNET